MANNTGQTIPVSSNNDTTGSSATVPVANIIAADSTSALGSQPAAATMSTAQLVQLITALQSGQSSGPKNHKPKHPESYDGKYDMDAENHVSAANWVKQVNRYFSQCGGVWTDEMKINTLIGFTTGIAANWCERWLVENVSRDYSEFCNHFIKRHTPATEQRDIMNKLDRLKPKVEHALYTSALEEYNMKFNDLSLQLVQLIQYLHPKLIGHMLKI